MPNYTPNLNLYKWDKTDAKVDTITEMSNNSDKIDTKFQSVDQAITQNQQSITSVDTKADSALTKATQAETSADEAVTNSNQAKQTAQSAADQATTATTTANEAKTLATDAKSTADTVKTQFDEVTKATTIDPQVTQALVGADGKTYTNIANRFDTVDAHLAQKATKGEITRNDLDRTSDANLLDINDFNETSRATLQGLAPGQYNAVLGEKNVAIEHVAFADKSPNLFNKDTVTIGIILDTTNGSTTVDTNYAVSEFIPIEVGKSYKRSHQSRVCFYDENYQYLSCYPSNTTYVTAVTSAKYAKVSVAIQNLDLYQFEEGTVTTPYKFYDTFEMKKINVDELNLSPKLKEQFDGLNEFKEVANYAISPLPTRYPDEIFYLIDENDPILPINANFKQDLVKRWGKNDFGWRIDVFGAKTSEIRSEFAAPKTKEGVSTICGMFYLEDASKINTISIYVGTSSSGWNWIRSVTELKNGWNFMRIPATLGTIGDWKDFYRVRIVVSTKDTTSWTLGALFGEVPQKAKILFVEDGGYVEFLERGYPALKARGIPTTWALNPGRLGVGRVISEADVDTLALDYMSAFSFHSWAAEVHADMPADEVRNNAIKCMRWLQKKGIQPKYWMRAAITQNSAVNHSALQDLVEAYSSPVGGSGLTVFPFPNPFGYARLQLHGRTNADFDTYFDTLKKTRSLMVGYTHGVGLTADTGEQLGTDMTQASFDYFLTKVDQGISEGWLEGVTYDTLRIRQEQQSGGYGFNHLLDATRK